MSCVWEDIRGFASPGEYKRFCAYIDGQVAAGIARELNPDPARKSAMIFGGRCFEDVETGEIWRLVPPDFPFRGAWERAERS